MMNTAIGIYSGPKRDDARVGKPEQLGDVQDILERPGHADGENHLDDELGASAHAQPAARAANAFPVIDGAQQRVRRHDGQRHDDRAAQHVQPDQGSRIEQDR